MALRSHAREAYPEECCGFLLIREEASTPGTRLVVSVERGRNVSKTQRTRRFTLAPEVLRALESRLEGSRMTVGGFYHSHPDGPARPSALDAEEAWPWYTHVVLGVTPRTVGPVRGFEYDGHLGIFALCPLSVTPSSERGAGGRDPKSLLDESGAP